MNTPTKSNEPHKVSTSTPNWLVSSVNKKKIFAPIFFLVDDIVSKYTTRTPKPMRTKSIAKIMFDNVMGKIITKVATYNHKEGTDELDLSNFEVTHTNLGVINHDTKEHWVEASTK